MPSGPFAPLKRPEVAMMWAAGVISDVGTWVQLIIVGSLIARNTGSAWLTGMSAMATFTPQGVFSPLGGMLADRFDRRRLFGTALAGQAAATTVLAVLLSNGIKNPFALAGVIFFQSSFGAFGQPSYQAMLPDLVPAEELQAMVGLGIASWNAGRILGPIMATVLDQTVGAPAAIIGNALTFAAVTVAVAFLRRPFPPSAKFRGESPIDQLRIGARALFHSQGCWVAVQVTVGLNLVIAPFIGLMPIFARKVLHGGTTLAGLCSSAQGIGALVGALAIGVMISRWGRYTTLRIGIGLMLAFYFVYAAAPNPVVALAVLPIMGFGTAVFFTSMMSLAQRDAPADQRGRVMSLVNSTTGSSYGLAIIGFGNLADSIGLRQTYLVAAALGVAMMVVGTLRYRHWPAIIDIGPPTQRDLSLWQPMPEF